MIETLFILGTRPEAIKLCPVILNQRSRGAEFQPKLCVTAQHRHLLDQVLAVFGITPDFDLNLMLPGQTLFESTSRIVAALGAVLADGVSGYDRRPRRYDDYILWRTGGILRGCPGSACRGGSSHRRYAPAVSGRNESYPHGSPLDAALLRDGRGKTESADGECRCGADSRDRELRRRRGALRSRRSRTGRLAGVNGISLDPAKKLVLVTAHRRESFGAEFESMCRALGRLATRNDTQIVYPVHPNPNVQDPVERLLRGLPNVILTEPLPYVPFVDLMRKAYILLTDSGGIQEEGPSLGKPVLVMREKTERPEAVEAGTVKLVGTSEDRIYAEASRLLEDDAEYQRMARVHNPYGDGFASERISDYISKHFD